MKKVLSIVLSLLIVISAIPFYAVTSSAVENTVYIRGDWGYRCDAARTYAVIAAYYGSSAEAVIPDKIDDLTVVGIGGKAFKGRSHVTDVKIPDTVIHIGANAFDGTALYNTHFSNIITTPLYVDNHLVACKNTVSGHIVIPEGTKSIADNAFLGCAAMMSVTLPDSLITIGTNAFKDCTILNTITNLSDNVKYIGEKAFYNTKYYNNSENWTGDVLYIGNHLIDGTKVTGEFTSDEKTITIADGAFKDSLAEKVTLIGNINRIGAQAFYNCAELTTISLESGLTSIGENAFFNCNNLNSMNFQADSLDDWAAIVFENEYSNPMAYAKEERFNGQKADIVDFCEDTTTTISNYMFYGSDDLADVWFDEGISYIGYKAFANCNNLQSVYLPYSMKTINEDAFKNCVNLENMYFDGIAEDWVGIDFKNEYANPMYYAQKEYFGDTLVKDVIIRDFVEVINYDAFNGCTSLTTITLPRTLKTVKESAFEGCDNLTDVYYDGTKTEWGNIYIMSYNDDLKNAEIHYRQETVTPAHPYKYTVKEDGTIKITGYTGSTAQLTIPKELDGYTVTEIGDSAFYNKQSLTDVVIPDTVTVIGAKAFSKCDNLIMVTLPAGLKTIKNGAFLNNRNLRKVVIHEGCTTIEHQAFKDCERLNFITLPSTLTYVGNVAFVNTGYYNNAENWENDMLYIGEYLIACRETVVGRSTVKDGTKLIGIGAFYSCGEITEIILPDSLVYINDYAFQECKKLTDIVIPNSVIDVGAGAFDNCGALETVVIPDSVNSIGERAFSMCKSLKNVTLPIGLKEIKGHVFSNCRALETIIIPNSVTSIGEQAFWNCTSLTSITLPEGIEIIGRQAFQKCTSLSSVIIPNSLKGICHEAFESCTGLKDVYYNGTADEWVSISFNEDGFGDSNPLEYAENLYFNNELVADVVLANAARINPGSFINYKKLNSIYVPKTVTSIGFDSFLNCDNLADVFYEGTQEEWTALYNYNEIPKTATIHYGVTNPNHYILKTVLEPTCTEQGIEQYVCSCGYVKEPVTFIEPTGHSYGEWMITTPATCMAKGEEARICECGVEETRELPLLAHTYGEWELETVPTETQSGTKKRICECDAVEIAELTMEEYDNVFKYTFRILTPTITTIRYKDGIVLHASLEGNIPENTSVEWTTDNDNFKLEQSEDGSTLTIISDKNGMTVITATLYDADGNVLLVDTVEMTSKANFFNRIGGFFRGIFGSTKIYEK